MAPTLQRMRTRQAIVLLVSVLSPVAAIFLLHVYDDGPTEYGSILFLTLVVVAAIAQAWRLRYRMNIAPSGMLVEPIKSGER